MEDFLRRFGDKPDFRLRTENVVYVTERETGRVIVPIYTGSRRAEFDEDFRDPMPQGDELRELAEYLMREGYKTNLK